MGPYLGEVGFWVFRLQGLGAERLRVSSPFFWVGVVHDLFRGFGWVLVGYSGWGAGSGGMRT